MSVNRMTWGWCRLWVGSWLFAYIFYVYLLVLRKELLLLNIVLCLSWYNCYVYSDSSTFIEGCMTTKASEAWFADCNVPPPPLVFSVRFLQTGAVQLRITEDHIALKQKKRWEPALGDVILPQTGGENVKVPSMEECNHLGSTTVNLF